MRQVPIEGGGVLLRALSRFYFLRPGRHSDIELKLFDLVIGAVLAKVEPVARAELARRLAPEARPPRRVLLALAEDRIAVAEPVLRLSPALTDDDLHGIASRRSQAHLCAIAGRASLSERLTDVLLDRGGLAVVKHVAANRGARISPDGFVRLLGHAAGDRMVCGFMAARPDLPEEVVARLEPLLQSSLDETLSVLATDASTALRCDLMQETRAALVQRLREEPLPLRPGLLASVESGLVLLEDAILELADADAAAGLADLLARRLGLPPGFVVRALLASAEQPIMIVARAAGLSADAFSAVLRMRRRRRRLRRDPAGALAAFAGLPPAQAKRMVADLAARLNTPRPD
jgi:hypothetical protein